MTLLYQTCTSQMHTDLFVMILDILIKIINKYGYINGLENYDVINTVLTQLKNIQHNNTSIKITVKFIFLLLNTRVKIICNYL